MVEAVEVGVLLGVWDAVMVVVGSGVFVAVADGVRVEVDVFEGVIVGVDEAVGVLVGGSPVKSKSSRRFPFVAGKDLDFVKAWQPFICGLYPYCLAETFAFIVPRFGFVILQCSVVIPEGCPLHA